MQAKRMGVGVIFLAFGLIAAAQPRTYQPFIDYASSTC